ncbi:MAG: DUF418 domain-containing protein [Nocardiopsaceae bacterium]|nr:DUF418 domain-containing protein [Nocardiopsaceae bacterium]
MNTGFSPLRGPVRPAERALAPDLARGFMLLLIALANTPWYLWAAQQSPYSAHPIDGSAPDRVVQFAMVLAVDGRIFPMFAFLFGYGMMRTFDRQREAGTSERGAAALLRRRNVWLLVFGFAHAALLFMGDILGAYGVAGLLLGWLFLRRAERTLWIWVGVTSILVAASALLSIMGAVFASSTDTGAADTAGLSDLFGASFGMEDPFGAMLNRIMVWTLMLPLQVLAVVIPAAILLGMAAGRRRILERPQHHLRLLAWTAVGGIGAAWATGLPEAMAHVGLLEMTAAAEGAMSGARQFVGLFGGAGYVALFGLIGHWLSGRERQGVATTAVVAVGKRSLSCYLAQSVICAPVLAAWGLGLGGAFGSAQMAAFAAAVWLVTVGGAYALERADRRGPAEVLLRRLSYRHRSPAKESSPAQGTAR